MAEWGKRTLDIYVAALEFFNEEKMLAHFHADSIYRTEILPRKLDIDLRYVESHNLWRGVTIFLATARGVVLRAGGN